MFRLWNRVGVFRAMSVIVLALGLAGGIALAQRSTTEDRTSTTTVLAADADDDVRQLAQDLTDRQDAQTKADQVATSDAERVKAADEQARKNQAAARSQSRSTKPGVNAGPVPASCGEYSGNRAIGCTLLLQAGFGLDQMPCLEKLWTKESGWNEKARNPNGAAGIPQAYPGSKMAAFGDDWQTNPATQIAWGLSYIKGKYGTPCNAWSHFLSANSY